MENLWRKECAQSFMYVDLFPSLTVRFNSTPTEVSVKNDEKSVEFRLRGNELFHENKITEAMECYNQSLCFAEIGSENVSLSYANRASCFLALRMYNEALIDIGFARDSNYPHQLLPKLQKREANCLRLRELSPPPKIFQPALDFPAHEQFPCLANVLKITANEKYGRHIIAKGDIDVGETILVEQNFAAAPIGDGNKKCSNCMKTKANFIACFYCTDALFCCFECMDQDAAHKITCGSEINGIYGAMKLHIQTILIAISLFRNAYKLMKFVENIFESDDYIPETVIGAKSRYRMFLTLQATFNAQDKDDLMEDAENLFIVLHSLPAIKRYFDTFRKQRFLQHLVLHHLVVISWNRFQHMSGDNESDGVTDLPLMACVFNHSCAPNVFNNVIDNKAVFITIRPVKKGDQLFVSYLGSETGNTTDSRQNRLMRNFGFVCECDKCLPHCSPADTALMVSDPYFKYVHLNYKTAFPKKCQRATLKQCCICFLVKFGHLPWSEELNFVTLCYLKWLFEYMTIDFDFELTAQQ